MQIPTVITTNEALIAFCESLRGEAFVTLDTEFIRERTFYPRLCLLQAASSKEAVAIDPLAEGIDLAPLFAVMQDTAILKVFHAAGQDLEIFYHLTGALPTPMFDTQIAAMACGFGESASYETLVREMVGASLDKASRFTDWAKRPLTPRQLHYALDDVIHLRKIYTLLAERLERDGRSDWVAQELAELRDLARYTPDAENAWQRLKIKSRAPEFLQALRAVAKWREEEAIRRDVPRGRVLMDDVALQIAASIPESPEELKEIRGVYGQLSTAQAQHLCDVLQEARMAPRESFPVLKPRPHPMNGGQEACLDLLKMLLKQCCEEAHIVPRLVASKDELEEVVRGNTPLEEAHFMQGWRREVFGVKAAALLAGTLHITASHSKKGYALKWQVVA